MDAAACAGIDSDAMSLEAAITEEGGPAPAGAPIRVRRALISVSDKTGVVDFARGLRRARRRDPLHRRHRGGDPRRPGIEVTDVSDVHRLAGDPRRPGEDAAPAPARGAARAARRSRRTWRRSRREGIEPIDLVCVNLYPFERTVAAPGVTEEEAIENIDIGGPTMIRAAAKNHADVAVVVRPESYDAVLAELDDSGGEISAETRHWLANEAFAHTAAYDAAISRWFGLRYEVFPSHFVMSLREVPRPLLRREPAPEGGALRRVARAREHVLSGVAKLHGKGAVVQQRARPRLGAAAARRVRASRRA